MSNYVFTQPIRYYKANDPYYYEVDNIPLRQLEENILYVKSLIEGDTGDGGSGGSDVTILTSNSELNLSNIKQLRPKSTGGRQVTVNAGIFNSRVNDAFDIAKPLTQLFNIFTGPGDTVGTVGDTKVIKDIFQSFNRDDVWDAFTGTAAAAKSYSINGLEFAYTFHSTPGKITGNWGWTADSGFSVPDGEGTNNYPKYVGPAPYPRRNWPGYARFGPLAGAIISLAAGAGNQAIEWTSENLPDIHQAFVKMWRGVFRTTVVDFPESTIEIPSWNDEDFYYYDENDNKVIIDADQRIDLLVAYSVSIDSSGTALQDYETGFGNTGGTPSPRKITRPVLGLYKGAGVGIKKADNNNAVILTREGLAPDTPPPGSARIVGNASDKLNTNNQGITAPDGTKIYGSFPTPDDLLNMAPVIALGLDSDDLQLVGQAALPLAYIVVKKSDTNITQNDIIDIRPFLRTTELTYNERAGVAAANPPLSFANPAVGSYTLQRVVDGIQTNIDSIPEPEKDGQALYTDYVMGGLAYGVEGTLLTMCDYTNGPTDPFGSQSTTTYTNPVDGNQYSLDFTSPKQFLESVNLTKREAFLQYLVEQRQGSLKRWLSDPNTAGLGGQSGSLTYLGLPQGDGGRNIPVFPEWDLPVDSNNLSEFFATTPKVSWWMHFDATTQSRTLAYAPGGVISEDVHTLSRSHLLKEYMFGSGDQTFVAGYNVCTKKVQVTLPPWCNDYDVIVEYTNCSPLTSMAPTTGPTEQKQVGTGGGLFVNKGPIFTESGTGLRHAVFQINSIADNVNAGSFADPDASMVTSGRIKDQLNPGFEQSPNIKANRPHHFLSYAVVLPQFRQTKWDMSQQVDPIANIRRYAPKTGGAYYPTVKFTIVGYKDSTFTRNQAYTSGNKFSLIQNIINGQGVTNLLGPQAPVTSPSNPSVIDIRNVT